MTGKELFYLSPVRKIFVKILIIQFKVRFTKFKMTDRTWWPKISKIRKLLDFHDVLWIFRVAVHKFRAEVAKLKIPYSEETFFSINKLTYFYETEFECQVKIIKLKIADPISRLKFLKTQ